MLAFSPETFASVAAGIESLITALGFVAAGLWTYGRFVNRREAHARLAFDPIIRFVMETDDVWMAEVVAQIENRGEVRHVIREIRYELGLCDRVPAGPMASTGSLESILPGTKIAERSWLPDGCEYIFVEPGVKAEFCACVAIPKSTQLICLKGFFSSGKNEFFFGERLFALPKAAKEPQGAGPVLAAPEPRVQLIDGSTDGQPGTLAPDRRVPNLPG
jgi:hypothetical protein